MLKVLAKPVLLFYRAHGYTETVVNQCLLAFMPDSFIKALSESAYLSQQYSQSEWNERGLFAWERNFVQKHVGENPGRILVPGCGGGRETVSLARQGHHVVGFDPVGVFLDTCRRTVEAEKLPVRLFKGGYEDLLKAPVITGADGSGYDLLSAETIEESGPFDAVLLGWGSINHVRHRSTLEEVLRFLAAPSICPRGAVLASFWMRVGQQSPPGSVKRFLMRFGRRSEQEMLVKGMYGRWYTRDEIDDLAGQAGLVVLEASWDGARSFGLDSSYAVLGRPKSGAKQENHKGKVDGA